MLADGTVALLAAEKLIKKVVEGILLIWLRGITSSAPAMWTLNGRFGVDVDHSGFQLLRDLRELVRELLGRRDGQRSGIGALPLLAFDSLGNNGSNKNANRQRDQNRERVCRAV